MKSFPDCDKLIDMTPVDHVAKLIVAISLQQKITVGRTFHIRKSKPISYKEIGCALQSFGFSGIHNC
jgi:hypothetical protein